MAAEIELKLLIDPADILKLRRMPALKTWSTARPVSRKLVTTYYDMPDQALWHAGIALRVRRLGRGWIQTIKGGSALRAGLHQRMEWESPVVRSTPDLSKITDHALLKLFSHHALRDRLQPVFITRFRRTSWLLSFAEGDEIELSLD
jgi:inorganic triphosphatase YgiF